MAARLREKQFCPGNTRKRSRMRRLYERYTGVSPVEANKTLRWTEHR